MIYQLNCCCSTEMPQIFQVLRCYKCLTFQVHQTKKSNKFACKICDENQSIKRHYAIGIAKDCRMHVQKLNMMRGEKDETTLDDISNEYDPTNTSNSLKYTSDTADNVKKTSKWLSYIDKQIEETDIDESQISETNTYKKNKRWPRNNKYQNYKDKKNNASKGRHCNVNEENDLSEVENILENGNTQNVFGKRPLFEHGDECRGVNKVSKPTFNQDKKLQIDNREIRDNLKDLSSINKNPKLETQEVNKSSKWAQFIEKDESFGEENYDNEAVEHVTKNIQPLFSFCDESDIDEVLDI